MRARRGDMFTVRVHHRARETQVCCLSDHCECPATQSVGPTPALWVWQGFREAWLPCIAVCSLGQVVGGT